MQNLTKIVNHLLWGDLKQEVMSVYLIASVPSASRDVPCGVLRYMKRNEGISWSIFALLALPLPASKSSLLCYFPHFLTILFYILLLQKLIQYTECCISASYCVWTIYCWFRHHNSYIKFIYYFTADFYLLLSLSGRIFTHTLLCREGM
jgi:hypothetical protein